MQQIQKLLQRVLDEDEFLSDYGIRALSKHHKENPYVLKFEEEELSVSYVPGESDSAMFGGNSNWRGPIWFPMNYLMIESLWKLDFYYDDNFKIEHPAGSGISKTVKEPLTALSGSPAISHKENLKSQVVYRKLPELMSKINQIEK